VICGGWRFLWAPCVALGTGATSHTFAGHRLTSHDLRETDRACAGHWLTREIHALALGHCRFVRQRGLIVGMLQSFHPGRKRA
jgi:hypothetical protein